MSEPQADRVTCGPSHNACSTGPDPSGNRGPRIQATLLCRLERRPLLHMAGLGLSPPARASRGVAVRGGGALGADESESAFQ